VSSLLDQYQPRWLYLHEFGEALPSADEGELKEAIALLVRDRLVVDGKLNEHEFRFLEGKPDLRTAAWINNLRAEDFNWADSQLLAGVDTSKAGTRVSDHVGLLIEIAADCLDYFAPSGKEHPRQGLRLPSPNDAKIRDEVRATYDEAERSGSKPPNTAELGKLVSNSLKTKGYFVAQHRASAIGDEAEFLGRRRPVGKTIASERKTQPG
jgi:hypothetical protein